MSVECSECERDYLRGEHDESCSRYPWQARAEQAEAENAKLRARVEELQHANTKQALHIINLGGRISELEIQRKTLHAVIDDLIVEREKWKPELEAQMKQAREDSRMLDWLDAQLSEIPKFEWYMQRLDSGGSVPTPIRHGFYTHDERYEKIRAAIRAAMDQAKQEEKK